MHIIYAENFLVASLTTHIANTENYQYELKYQPESARSKVCCSWSM